MNTNSIAQKRRGSSDPRYKNGVYTNTRGQREDAAARKRKALADNHPLSNGWIVAGECKLTGFTVYKLQANNDVHLRRSETGRFWIVWIPKLDQIHFDEAVRDLTTKVHELLEPRMSLAEQERLRAEWEAANPPDDYGLEGRS